MKALAVWTSAAICLLAAQPMRSLAQMGPRFMVSASASEVELEPNLIERRYESSKAVEFAVGSDLLGWELYAAFGEGRGPSGPVGPGQVWIQLPGQEWQDLSAPRLIAVGKPGQPPAIGALRLGCTRGAAGAPGLYSGAVRLLYRPTNGLEPSEGELRRCFDLGWRCAMESVALINVSEDLVRFRWNGQTQPVPGDRTVDVEVLSTFGQITVAAAAEPLSWTSSIPSYVTTRRGTKGLGIPHPDLSPGRLFVFSSNSPDRKDQGAGPGYRPLDRPVFIVDPTSNSKTTLAFKLLVRRYDHAGSYQGKVTLRMFAKP